MATIGHWLDEGMTTRTALILTEAGCRSLDDVRRKGLAFFRSMRGVGDVTLEEISASIGQWPDERKGS